LVELCRLVAEVTTVPGGPAPSVTPETALADLPLDSLRRVSLALRVEEVLGVPLTDDAVAGAVTVADLAARIAAGGEGEPSVPDVTWARSTPACLVREVLDRTFIRWLLAIVARPRVEGFEHVADLPGPALLCPNHTSHLDGPAVRLALPPDRRRRTLVATSTDYHVAGWLLGPAFAIVTAAFPFGRLNDVRASLERVGDLLSEGWSVVVFPEGVKSPDGRLGAMREGIGLLAVATGLPVVPVWIEGAHAVLPGGGTLPRRRKGARVVVRFGEPLRFGPDTPTTEATAAVGRAIAALQRGAG
jgi:1-acyl-sn-glycerol-3-phosphate acyltransferase/acyl carrier protein